jgi:phage regulator Rha-like protein
MNPTKWLEQEVRARIDMLRAAARDAEQWTNELEQGKQSEMLLRNGISKREAVAFTRGQIRAYEEMRESLQEITGQIKANNQRAYWALRATPPGGNPDEA